MSYEGYVEVLCKCGHMFNFDCYNDPSDKPDWRCTTCGAEVEYRGNVDMTNGLDETTGYYPGQAEFEEIDRKSCETCHTVLDTRFRLVKTGTQIVQDAYGSKHETGE